MTTSPADQPSTEAGREILAIHRHEAHSPDAGPDVPCNMRLLLVKAEAQARQSSEARDSVYRRGAERLADEVAALVKAGKLGSRSPAADALLDFRDPPDVSRDTDRARVAQLTEALTKIATMPGYRANFRPMKDIAAAALSSGPSSWLAVYDWCERILALSDLSAAAATHDARIASEAVAAYKAQIAADRKALADHVCVVVPLPAFEMSASCTYPGCRRSLGWYCPDSPDHLCHYGLRNHDRCEFCGQPEERK